MEQRNQKQIPTGIQRMQLSAALVVWETISAVFMVPVLPLMGIQRSAASKRHLCIVRISVFPLPATVYGSALQRVRRLRHTPQLHRQRQSPGSDQYRTEAPALALWQRFPSDY